MKLAKKYTGLEAKNIICYSKNYTEQELIEVLNLCTNNKMRGELLSHLVQEKSNSFKDADYFFSVIMKNFSSISSRNSSLTAWKNVFNDSCLTDEHKETLKQKILSEKEFINKHFIDNMANLFGDETAKKYLLDNLKNRIETKSVSNVENILGIMKSHSAYSIDMKEFFYQNKETIMDMLFSKNSLGSSEKFISYFVQYFNEEDKKIHWKHTLNNAVFGFKYLQNDIMKKNKIPMTMVFEEMVKFFTNDSVKLPEELIDQIQGYEVMSKLISTNS